MKRVAVIGAGAAGLLCADALGENTAVLYDVDARAGGHAHTVCVEHNGAQTNADVAFMVFNGKNYPVFCDMLARKGIKGRATAMSFSMTHEEMRMEYNGGNLRGLFADPLNLFRPRFLRMLANILRFNFVARADLRAGSLAAEETLAQYAKRRGLSGDFLGAYLLPMGAAIWSCSREAFAKTPARFVLAFYHNYGLLQLFNRPQWMQIPGGSKRYVDAIVSSLAPGAFRGGAAVTSVRAEGGGVFVRAHGEEEERFDAAVIAAHAPDALRMIVSPSLAEREVLSAFVYTKNKGVLHTDDSILPSRRAAWACWNYRVFGRGDNAQTASTYNLSMLQHLPGGGGDGAPLLLTLNDGIGKINAEKVIARFEFEHPLPDAAAVRARERWGEINGKRGLFFCGAYWGDGFHEDAAASGARAAQAVLDFLRDGERRQ